MPIPMDPASADKLKRLLRERAKEIDVNLSSPDYKFTFWLENAGQGYMCNAHGADKKIVEHAMQYFIYSGGVILEIKESGDTVTLFTCEVG